MSPQFPYIFVSEDFRDAFCVAGGGAFGCPWLRWIRRPTLSYGNSGQPAEVGLVNSSISQLIACDKLTI